MELESACELAQPESNDQAAMKITSTRVSIFSDLDLFEA
jgi:hypothetical protein